MSSGKSEGDRVAVEDLALGDLAGLVFFALVWAVVLVSIEAIHAKEDISNLRSSVYPRVTGQILRCKRGMGAGVGRVRGVELEYTYRVAEVDFIGTVYRYAARSGSDDPQVYSLYPGQSIDVFYNPNDPADAVLRPGIDGSDRWFWLFCAPFNVIGIIVWADLLKKWRFSATGGAPCRDDGATNRIEVGWRPSQLALAAAGLVALLLACVLGGANHGELSSLIAADAWLVTVLSGAAIWLWLRRFLARGERDLVIDRANQTITLPPTTFPGLGGRAASVTLAWRDVAEVSVDRCGGGRYVPVAVVVRSDESRSRVPLSPFLQAWSANALSRWVALEIGSRQAPARPPQKFVASVSEPALEIGLGSVESSQPASNLYPPESSSDKARIAVVESSTGRLTVLIPFGGKDATFLGWVALIVNLFNAVLWGVLFRPIDWGFREVGLPAGLTAIGLFLVVHWALLSFGNLLLTIERGKLVSELELLGHKRIAEFLLKPSSRANLVTSIEDPTETFVEVRGGPRPVRFGMTLSRSEKTWLCGRINEFFSAACPAGPTGSENAHECLKPGPYPFHDEIQIDEDGPDVLQLHYCVLTQSKWKWLLGLLWVGLTIQVASDDLGAILPSSWQTSLWAGNLFPMFVAVLYVVKFVILALAVTIFAVAGRTTVRLTPDILSCRQQVGPFGWTRCLPVELVDAVRVEMAHIGQNDTGLGWQARCVACNGDERVPLTLFRDEWFSRQVAELVCARLAVQTEGPCEPPST